jgi:hypothetical protein
LPMASLAAPFALSVMLPMEFSFQFRFSRASP